MSGNWKRLGRATAAGLLAAVAIGCSGTKATTASAVRPEPGAMVAATPREVVAAAEQAFIELNLKITSAESTARGGCALAQTADGETITVTATTLANRSSLVRIHFAIAEDDLMGSHLLESISAHLSVGMHAMMR